jgi:hypothetical protein
VLFVLLILFAIAVQAQSPILGVLEDVPPLGSGTKHRRAVRVVFEKRQNEWRAFPSRCPDEQCLSSLTSKYPQKVQWTVAFDGKTLGHVTSTTPPRYNYYAEEGLQNLADTSSAPTVGNQSRDFGGYTAESVYRPLVTNSLPFVSDPDRWKRSPLSGEQVAKVRRAFRKHFGKLCQLDKDELKPLPYTDESVKVVSSYNSLTGWAVARVHVQSAVDCADTEAGFEIDDSWFAVNPRMEAQHLDDGMWLVDAGDYDNDGQSELVFSIDRDNCGGYELFYDNFRRRVVFEYSYH